jgi:hypothetical protein
MIAPQQATQAALLQAFLSYAVTAGRQFVNGL